MELTYYDVFDYKLHNPSTGEIISSDFNGLDEDAVSLIAYWVDLVFEKPFIKDDVLKAKWEQFTSEYKVQNKGYSPCNDDLEKFLKNFENTEWKVIVNTSGKITAWFIVDKNVIIEEEGEVFED